MRGVNLTQTSITAHELYASVPLHRSPAAAAEAGASIVMAAGPFTTAEDLTYEPLQVRRMAVLCTLRYLSDTVLLGMM